MGESAVSPESIKALFSEQKELFQSFFGKLDYEQIHKLADLVRSHWWAWIRQRGSAHPSPAPSRSS